MKKIIAIVAALAAAVPAIAAPREASIPFVSHGGIRNFEAVDRDTLYIQDQHRRWYRAELMGACPDLMFDNAIGFETRGTNSFDRFSALIVDGRRCHLQSLTRSDPPPRNA